MSGEVEPITMSVQLLQAFGPYFLGIVAIVMPIVTIRRVNRKQLLFSEQQQQTAWENRFLDNYIAFWKDDDLAKVRYWITNDNGYEEIRKILENRAAGTAEIDKAHNKVLEKIDRFCSRLAVYDAVGEANKHEKSHIKWVRNHKEYWRGLIEQRTALKAYMKEHWSSLLDWLVKEDDGKIEAETPELLPPPPPPPSPS